MWRREVGKGRFRVGPGSALRCAMQCRATAPVAAAAAAVGHNTMCSQRYVIYRALHCRAGADAVWVLGTMTTTVDLIVVVVAGVAGGVVDATPLFERLLDARHLIRCR